MAENIPTSIYSSNEEPSDPQSQFSSDEIRNKLTSINNYLSTNRPAILQGITEAQAKEDAIISSAKDYLPKPSLNINKVENIVSGNNVTGPNPGMKNLNSSYDEYMNARVSKAKLNIDNSQDPFYFARPTSFNASKYGIQYDRYYTHPKFKDLGFSIYRDNESIYNDRSSWTDDFTRMAKKFPGLLYDGGSGLFKNWGKFGTFGAAQDAAEMENDLNIASSTKGGAGAWTTNFLANSAYTVGILLEMGVENIALNAANFASRGALTPLVASRNAMSLSRLGKSISTMVRSLSKVDKAKSFWKGAEGVASWALPFEELRKVGKQAFQANSAFNRLSDYGKVAKTFGAFYRGMREINAVTAESRLEGGFVANKVSNEALTEFYKKNNRMPNPDEASIISNKGARAGEVATIANIPAIYFSNKVVLETALKGFSPIRRLMSKEGLNSNIFKTVRNYDWKTTGKKPMDVVSRGVISGAKKTIFSKEYLKSIPSRIKGVPSAKNVGKTFGGGLRYFSANLMEGLQESYQEAAQSAISDYYLKSYYADLYEDPILAAKNSSVASMFKAIDEQFSVQGLDVFAQGFLMGGLMGPAQSTIARYSQRGSMKFTDLVNKTDQYGEYVKSEKERLQKYADAVNSYTENPAIYSHWLDENVKMQRDLAERYNYAEETGDREEAESTKDDSLFVHIDTLLKTDRFDGFIEQLEDFRELSDDELKEAFDKLSLGKEQNKKPIRSRIDTAIKKAKDIKQRTEDVDKKFKNIYNPDFFDKDKDKDAYESELLGYNSFEEAKRIVAFNEYTYDRTIKRIAKLVNNASMVGPLGDVAAADFAIIYGSDDAFENYMGVVISEIDALNLGSKKDKSKARKKETQLKNLVGLKDQIKNYRTRMRLIDAARPAALDPENATEEQKKILEHLVDTAKQNAKEMDIFSDEVDPVTGEITVDFEKAGIDFDVILTEYAKDKIFAEYAKYTKNLTELNNVYPLLDDIENSFGNLMDFINLDYKARRLSDAINVLADPMAIYNMDAKIKKARETVKKESKKLHLKAVKDYKRNIQDIDDLLNELFGIGVMFDPDHIKEFRKTGKLPDQFINASDGTLITPQDEKYKEIVEIIEEAEARRGETFGNKPVVPKAAEPVVSEQAPHPVTEAPPEQELEYEPEDYDVTTEFNKLPLAIKEALREEHKKSIDENNGMQTDIQDWMRESVIAASIIAGTYKPSTYKKEDGEPEEIKEENLITPKTSKSFTTSTPATENIYKQYEEEGWEVDPNDNSKYINSKKPESERESVPRVSSILGKVFEESNYLRATQGRGNVVDILLRWFSTPSSVQFYAGDVKLPINISPKDAIINMVTLGTSRAQIIESFGGETEEEAGGIINSFLNQYALKNNKINIERSVSRDLAEILFELATRTRDFTWHTNVPAMVGTVNGKRYGGTIDLLFEKDGKFYIADVKTSKKSRALDPRYAESDKVQLNAYADIFTQITGIPIEKLFTINITADISSNNKTILNAKLVKSEGVNGKEKVLNIVDRQPVDEVLKQKEKGEETPGTTTVDWNAVIDRAASSKEVDKIMDQIYAANASTQELVDKALVKKESFTKTPTAPVTTDAIDDINKRRQEELKPFKNLSFDDALSIINKGEAPKITFSFAGREDSNSYPEKPIVKEGNNYRIITGRYNVLIDSDFNIISTTSKEGKTYVYPSDKIGESKVEINSPTLNQNTVFNNKKSAEINAEYDAELVDEYRKQEIAEFRKGVENAESFIVNGRIDSKKVKASGNAKAKEIYDSYDKLITPLLPPAPVSDKEAKKAFLQKEKQEAIDRIADIENNLLPRITNRLDNNLQPELNKLYEKLRNTKDKTLQKEINDEIDKLKKKELTKNNIIELTKQKESLEGQIESAKKFIEKKDAELAALEGVKPAETTPLSKKEQIVKDLKEGKTVTGTIQRPAFSETKHEFIKPDGTKVYFYNHGDAITANEMEQTATLRLVDKVVVSPEETFFDVVQVYIGDRYVGNIAEKDEGVIKAKQGRVSLEDQYKNIINSISDVPSLLNFIAAYEANPNIINANVATVDDVAEMLRKKLKEIDDSPQSVSIINESIDDMVNKLKKEEVPGVNAEDKQSAQDAITKAQTISLEDAQAIAAEAKTTSQKDIDDEFFNNDNLNCQ